jgi:ribosomal protein S18 acetylase RimI-like enzyme
VAVEIRILKPGEENVLLSVAPEVFDNPVDPKLARDFLADPHHHIAVALDENVVVGFASGVDYIHPDKPSEMFINEVATAPTHRGQGVAKRVLAVLIGHAKNNGCVNAWVLTDSANAGANALYTSLGGASFGGDVVAYEFKTG